MTELDLFLQAAARRNYRHFAQQSRLALAVPKRAQKIAKRDTEYSTNILSVLQVSGESLYTPIPNPWHLAINASALS